MAVRVLHHHLPLNDHGRNVVVTTRGDKSSLLLHRRKNVVNASLLRRKLHVDCSLLTTTTEGCHLHSPQFRCIQSVVPHGAFGDDESVLVFTLVSLAVRHFKSTNFVGIFIAAGNTLSVGIGITNALKNIFRCNQRLSE